MLHFISLWLLLLFVLLRSCIWLMMYSCVDICSTEVWLLKSTNFLFFSLAIYPSFSLSTSPQTISVCCSHSSLLLYSPTHHFTAAPPPSHPTAQPLTWTTRPHLGNKLQCWTMNFNLHESGVYPEGDGVTRKFPRTLPVFPAVPSCSTYCQNINHWTDQKISFLKRKEEKEVQHLWIYSSPICLEILRKFSRAFGLLILRLLVLYFSTAFLTIRIGYQ